MDKVSYSFGVLVAQNLKQQGLNSINPTDFAAGVNDFISGAQPKINVNEINTIIQEYLTKQQKEAAGNNLEDGKKFLAENASKEGVVVLESGLQYKVLKEGTGGTPKATDKVTTHYHGTLINGKVFDSSVERGQPATFPVNGVIQGWVEALQLMKEGSKWRLFVPYNLAYGERGAGGDIKPFATLIFDVELIKIN